MPRHDLPPVVHVTWANLDWASEMTGYSRAELETRLSECEADGVVCAVEAKR